MKVENLYYHTHGRLFRVTALFQGPNMVEQANAHMLEHECLVLCQRGWVLMANKDDHGIPFDRTVTEGYCETCGHWSSQLHEGMCPPCRTRYATDDLEARD